MPIVYTVSLSANTQIQFVGNDITFSANVTPTSSFTYSWFFVDNNSQDTSTSSITYQYANGGNYYPIVKVSANNGNGSSPQSLHIKINPHYNITFDGIPATGEALAFHITNPTYQPGTITQLNWNFGDGATATMALPSNSAVHTYSAVGNYVVGLSAYDISGNVGISTINVPIVEGNLYVEKDDYITLCGIKQVNRYGASRYINLVNYLPSYLKDSPTQTFLQVFENFLNTMFAGEDGYTLSALSAPITRNYNTDSTTSGLGKMINTYDINTSAGMVIVSSDSSLSADKIYTINPDSLSSTDPRISILEKINRLTELHDPELIDLDYIQYFASNLGYNINVNRDEVGLEFGTTIVDSVPACSGAEQEKYLRFMVENLPSWYKIKTTNSAIKVMLYSFGLIADLATYYTGKISTGYDYLPSKVGGLWKIDFPVDSALTALNNDYYPTPHFAVMIDLAKSLESALSLDNLQPAIKAIDAIRPINAVFRRFVGYRDNEMETFVGMATESTVLQKINNGDAVTFSNWWYHP
jgi:hypothetical protein